MLRIKRQPQPLTVDKGETASFSVELEGQPAGPVTFSWKRNGSQLTRPSAPFLELSSVTLADAGYYSVAITDGPEPLESDMALLRVTGAQRARWDVSRLVFLGLAALALVLAVYIWRVPPTSCTVTTTLSSPTTSAKTAQRTVQQESTHKGSRTSSSEKTHERVRERKATAAMSRAASTNGCTIPGVTSGTVVAVESRNPADSKELVVLLVGLAAALALVAAFYSRIAKVTFPGGSIELREVAQTTKQAVGDASTTLAAQAQALEDVKAAIAHVRVDLEIESKRRQMLELELARLRLETPPPVAPKPTDGNT